MQKKFSCHLVGNNSVKQNRVKCFMQRIMTAFERNFEAKMEENNLLGSPLTSQRSRPNQSALSYKLNKSGSFNTATTIEESSFCDDFSTASKAKSPISKFDANMNLSTPNKKKSMMTMSAISSKSQKTSEKSAGVQPICVADEDSFQLAEDSNWWQSPKVYKEEKSLETETIAVSQSEQLPKVNVVVAEEPLPTKAKSSDRKKKVKRISMMKVKASDLGSLSAHQFVKTGDFATDQKMLQKALTQWKADQKQMVGSTTAPPQMIGSEQRPRSKSKARGMKENPTGSAEVLRQRSRSTGRRSSDTQIVDLTSGDNRSKSVSRRSSDVAASEKRRSRSVVRKENTEDEGENDCASGSRDRNNSEGNQEIRSRGRSVGAKRSSNSSGDRVRDKSVVLAHQGKAERERSRSVARQRPCQEDDDLDDEIKTEDSKRLRNAVRTRSVGLELGLEKVDRDTRSRSVARRRPCEEEEVASHSNSANSRRSSRSKECIKSEESRSIISSKSDGSQSRESTEKRRSKSLARKPKQPEGKTQEPNRGRSSVDGNISYDGDTKTKRSKSVGASLKERSNSSNIVKGRISVSGREDAFSTHTQSPTTKGVDLSCVKTQETSCEQEPSPSKSIPWTEFLMHAQSSSSP
jgi:hypothetical protein